MATENPLRMRITSTAEAENSDCQLVVPVGCKATKVEVDPPKNPGGPSEVFLVFEGEPDPSGATRTCNVCIQKWDDTSPPDPPRGAFEAGPAKTQMCVYSN
jgi:hypothetical protein